MTKIYGVYRTDGTAFSGSSTLVGVTTSRADAEHFADTAEFGPWVDLSVKEMLVLPSAPTRVMGALVPSGLDADGREVDE